MILTAVQLAISTLPGFWTNESRSVVVLIAPCGSSGFCGTVQSASEKAQADARRAGTPNLVGTEIMHQFVEIRPGRWSGILFVPDMRKKTKAEIVKLDSDRLRVRGCAVGRILCKSQIWTKIDVR